MLLGTCMGHNAVSRGYTVRGDTEEGTPVERRVWKKSEPHLGQKIQADGWPLG